MIYSNDSVSSHEETYILIQAIICMAKFDLAGQMLTVEPLLSVPLGTMGGL